MLAIIAIITSTLSKNEVVHGYEVVPPQLLKPNIYDFHACCYIVSRTKFVMPLMA